MDKRDLQGLDIFLFILITPSLFIWAWLECVDNLVWWKNGLIGFGVWVGFVMLQCFLAEFGSIWD